MFSRCYVNTLIHFSVLESKRRDSSSPGWFEKKIKHLDNWDSLFICMNSTLGQTTDQQWVTNLSFCASCLSRSFICCTSDQRKNWRVKACRETLATCQQTSQVSFGAFSPVGGDPSLKRLAIYVSLSARIKKCWAAFSCAVWLVKSRAAPFGVRPCAHFHQKQRISWINRIVWHVIYCVRLVIQIHLPFINHFQFLLKKRLSRLSLQKYHGVNIILRHCVSQKIICLFCG